jgi:hypothetical protein
VKLLLAKIKTKLLANIFLKEIFHLNLLAFTMIRLFSMKMIKIKEKQIFYLSKVKVMDGLELVKLRK